MYEDTLVFLLQWENSWYLVSCVPSLEDITRTFSFSFLSFIFRYIEETFANLYFSYVALTAMMFFVLTAWSGARWAMNRIEKRKEREYVTTNDVNPVTGSVWRVTSLRRTLSQQMAYKQQHYTIPAQPMPAQEEPPIGMRV